MHYNAGRISEAVAQYRHVLAEEPDNLYARRKLGGVLAAQGDLGEAIQHLRRAVEIDPRDAESHAELASALALADQPLPAVASYRTALNLQSANWPLVASRLARLLATHPEDRVRSGAEAVRLAEAACRQTNHEAPELLATLAAAYAEVGQFPKAESTLLVAMQKDRQRDEPLLGESVEGQLQLYRGKRPLREHPRDDPTRPSAPAAG